jgi:hypothetical protein
MKAKEYAKQFLEEKYDPARILLLIFRDMIREANHIVLKKNLQSLDEVSEVFENQAKKWEDMCGILQGYPINKNGFKLMLRAKAPDSYLKMTTAKLKPVKFLKED